MSSALSHHTALIRGAAVILVLLCTTAPGKAQHCVPGEAAVDQSFLPSISITYITGGFSGLRNYAQTFTVGADGVLTAVTLSLKGFGSTHTNSDLMLEVRRAPGGVPSTNPGDTLATATVTPAMVLPGFTTTLVTVDLSIQDVLVSTGDVLALVAIPVDLGSRYDLHGGVGYGGGSAFTWGANGPAVADPYDLLIETEVAPCVGPWMDLGNGLAGTGGVTPVLTGDGELFGNDAVTFSLSDARPGATAFFILGASDISVPFKGGVLVPSPDIMTSDMAVDGLGEIVRAFTWPAGVPSSVSLFYQYWIVDAGGLVGFAASNGLQSTTP